MLRSSNRGLIWTSRRENRLAHCVTVAEADVRVRVRGRVVRVHRQRRQVGVVSVVTTEETTDRPYSAAALFQPHHLTGTPIPMCALVGGMDFCFNDVAPHLHTIRAKCRHGFTQRKKKRSSPSLEMTSIFLNFRADRLTAVWVPSLSLGGRGRAAQFSFSALTSFGRVYVFVFYSVMRQQVPKPMYAPVYEGALIAPIANGDRVVSKAPTPRRKPRTDFLPALALPPVNQLYLPT